MSSVGSSGGPSGGPSGQAARWSERLGAATDRIGRWCDHWITALGIPAVLVIGASILLFGLGANGLWDPWEMDRAAVARTFHERPEISAAVATNGDESTALKDALLAAAEDAGVVLRLSEADGGKSATSVISGKTLQEALDVARTKVVAAVVLDLRLGMKDPTAAGAWESMAPRVERALDHLPNGKLILLAPWPEADAAALRQGLAAARVAKAWKVAEDRFGLAGLTLQPGELDAAQAAVAADLAEDEHIIFLTGEAQRADLARALAAAASVSGGVVQFKANGETKALAPLETWLISASYATLGVNEGSSRLPNALLGLLTLALLLFGLREAFGTRTAVVAGLVLVTTPFFFAQARAVGGEMGAVTGLTLVGVGVLLQAKGAQAHKVWIYLLSGVALGFMADGLAALLTYTVLTGAFALVAGRWSSRDLMPALVVAAIFALLCLWVLNAPPDGFAGQFRFTNKLFSAGPAAYDRNFDWLVRQIGFGGFPWSPIYVAAFVMIIGDSDEKRSRSSLALLLWFGVPIVVTMVLLKDFSHLVWIGAPAGAAAVAVFLDRLVETDFRSRLLALVVFIGMIILRRDLKTSPEPLASFLAFDPPFADTGALRFPEALKYPTVLRYASLLMAVAIVYRLFDVKESLRWLGRTFARRRPFWIAAGVLSLIGMLHWLGHVGFAYGTIPASEAALKADAMTFFRGFVTDPITSMAAIMALVVAGVLVVRFMLARGGAREAGAPRRLIALSLLLAGGAWMAAGAVALIGVDIGTAGYLGEVLQPKYLLAGVASAAAVGGLVWRARFGPMVAGVSAGGALGLMVAVRLLRDSVPAAGLQPGFGFQDGWHVLVYSVALAGFLPLAFGMACAMWRDAVAFVHWGLLPLVALLLLLVLPMADRWDSMSPLLYKGTAYESILAYITLRKTETAMLTYIPLFGLVVNYLFRKYSQRLTRDAREFPRFVAEFLDRGPIVVLATAVLGLAGAASAVAGFYPELSNHLSQKHIVDTYRKAEGLAASAPAGDNLFRHGKFGGTNREDANFYTAGIPEVRNNNEAVRILLGKKDQAVDVETVDGTEARLIPAWNPANDHDGDGRRDHIAERGIATRVASGTLVDETKTWASDQHKGKLLVDARGKTFPIVGNDANTLSLEGRALPAFNPGSPARNAYAIDDASAADPWATAEAPGRRYFLLPVDSFSQTNHAFRKLADGRHIPVLDSRSYRVLLAASELHEGEEQQNRYALHTLTRERFDADTDQKLRRVWVNFDDTIRLLGWKMEGPQAGDVVSKGEKFKLYTYYEVLAPVRSSYKIFMHIEKPGGTTSRIHADHWPLNLTEGGEHDKSCTGCYRTDHWLPGDVVIDVHEVEVPIGTPSGNTEINMGFYLPSGGKRLPVKSWDRTHARHDRRDDRVTIGSFQIR